MKLREIRIKNFRGLKDVLLPVEDTTILVGENNSGKTSLLHALRLALRQGTRASQFSEYDFYLNKNTDTPQTSEGIVIELWFREDVSDEWPEDIVQDLSNTIQLDPIKNTRSVGLRITSKFDDFQKTLVPRRDFLNLKGEALQITTQTDLIKFLNYVRLFYLEALRDPEDEFSNRSQYWRPILRSLAIDEKQMMQLQEDMGKINQALLNADPKLKNVTEALGRIQDVIHMGTGQNVDLQPLPVKPWELMAKSEIIIKGSGSDVSFPLPRHGQGIQSLSILFLFQAYVDVLLKPTFKPQTEAILSMEEPEAHLHPHAVRSLAKNLNKITSQKIISTHSPYFVQETPLTSLRLFRRAGPACNVVYIKKKLELPVPKSDELQKFCESSSGKFEYDEITSLLIAKGPVEENERKGFLKFYPSQNELQAEINKLCSESQFLINDDELSKLQRFVNRVRGEILFARGWFLCEGQSDYLLFQYFAEVTGKPLDQNGISLIDFQNNGSPSVFVKLAKWFQIPWVMICDNDDGGKGFVKQVQKLGLSEEEMKHRVKPLPCDGTDLEKFLVEHGFEQDYRSIIHNGSNMKIEELLKELRSRKHEYTVALRDLLRNSNCNPDRVPQEINAALTALIEMTT